MTGIVLLAAGASTRLGEPKQALLFQGKTLLQHALNAALTSVCEPVVVVVGAHAPTDISESGDKTVTVVKNGTWQEGMASSIRAGLEVLLIKAPSITSCIFMVCDQPHVKASVLNKLVQQAQESNYRIVASAYGDTLGTPVLFHKHFFPELLTLQGQEGAKKIVMKYREDVVTIPFPLGEIDIDTQADYNRLLRDNNTA